MPSHRYHWRNLDHAKKCTASTEMPVRPHLSANIRKNRACIDRYLTLNTGSIRLGTNEDARHESKLAPQIKNASGSTETPAGPQPQRYFLWESLYAIQRS